MVPYLSKDPLDVIFRGFARIDGFAVDSLSNNIYDRVVHSYSVRIVCYYNSHKK
jgi:hypothetical protein